MKRYLCVSVGGYGVTVCKLFLSLSINISSLNSERGLPATPPHVCDQVSHSDWSNLGGVFPLETSPPSGRALFPPADSSLSLWREFLLETSNHKKRKRSEEVIFRISELSSTSKCLKSVNQWRCSIKQYIIRVFLFLLSVLLLC